MAQGKGWSHGVSAWAALHGPPRLSNTIITVLDIEFILGMGNPKMSSCRDAKGTRWDEKDTKDVLRKDVRHKQAARLVFGQELWLVTEVQIQIHSNPTLNWEINAREVALKGHQTTPTFTINKENITTVSVLVLQFHERRQQATAPPYEH
ncbi:hypothetical protein WISP_37553 [Willisornis vidua]|uniref:Uncharacterized protein n=1 Tax=Willisornis vidua TaxID=1566151 RepID=A0ABQ9DIQ6_9PASS|nr:hypothetical protein WISP_37553 [Willisornis vidua]